MKSMEERDCVMLIDVTCPFKYYFTIYHSSVDFYEHFLLKEWAQTRVCYFFLMTLKYFAALCLKENDLL